MGQAIGGILPLAIAVDISVLSIIAVILMLITPRARSNGPAFVAGWYWGWLSSAGWCSSSLTRPVSPAAAASRPRPRHQAGPGGVALAAGGPAVAQPSRAGRAGPAPKWMAALDSFTPVKSLGLGAARSG
jgi:Sap-like sulfolipid-1-addressing protein